VDDFMKALFVIGAAFVVIMVGALFIYRREKKLEKQETEEK
jgi:preprotein translocase subunit YajC